MSTCTKCGAKFQTRVGVDSFYCDECLKGITLRIFNCDYCTCKDSEPEEVKRGVIMCLACNHQINPSEFAQDDDFSEAPPLVADDSEAYETRRLEDVTFDHYYR